MIQWLLTLKMQLFILSFSSGQRTAYSQEQGDALKKKCKLHLLKKLRIDHLWLWCCVINNNNHFKVFKYPREATKVSAEQHWRCWRRWSKQHIECEWAELSLSWLFVSCWSTMVLGNFLLEISYMFYFVQF